MHQDIDPKREDKATNEFFGPDIIMSDLSPSKHRLNTSLKFLKQARCQAASERAIFLSERQRSQRIVFSFMSLFPHSRIEVTSDEVLYICLFNCTVCLKCLACAVSISQKIRSIRFNAIQHNMVSMLKCIHSIGVYSKIHL